MRFVRWLRVRKAHLHNADGATHAAIADRLIAQLVGDLRPKLIAISGR
jgi:hypothetical protein